MRKTYSDAQLRQMLQVAHQRRVIAKALPDCISLAHARRARCSV